VYLENKGRTLLNQSCVVSTMGGKLFLPSEGYYVAVKNIGNVFYQGQDEQLNQWLSNLPQNVFYVQSHVEQEAVTIQAVNYCTFKWEAEVQCIVQDVKGYVDVRGRFYPLEDDSVAV